MCIIAPQTLICDVHAMTSDHHKWTQVLCQLSQWEKKTHTSDVLICPFAFANKRLLDRDGSKRHHIAPVRSVASVSLFFRMTNYSWRVSWFWPQLNLCAWTPPFLSPAQPTACCTTSRKWTLAPWNGTERAHALLSSLCVLSHKQRNCPSLFCFVFEIKALKLWRKTVSE